MEKMDRGEVRKLLAEGKTPQEVAAIFEARQAAAASSSAVSIDPASPTALYGAPPSAAHAPDVASPIVAAPDKENHELSKDSLLTYIREYSTGAEGVILDQGVFASQFNIPITAAQRLVNTLVKKGILDAEHKVIINGLVAGDISEAEIAETIKEPVVAVVTPDVVPKAPERKYGFTNRELLEFLKTKAGTKFNADTLLKNFVIGKGDAEEVIRDLKQARIIGDDDKVMDGATLERAEKDFEGHPTETLDDEYTFAPNDLGADFFSPSTSVVPPIAVTPAVVVPSPDATATPAAAPTPDASPTPDQPKTLEDFLKIPHWEERLNRYLSFSGEAGEDLEATTNDHIEHQAVYYRQYLEIKNKVMEALNETWLNCSDNLDNSIVYYKIFNEGDVLNNPRLSQGQKDLIEDFLNEYKDIVNGIKHQMNALNEAETKVYSMRDEDLRKIASESSLPYPTAEPADLSSDPLMGVAPGSPEEPADPEERSGKLEKVTDLAKKVITWRNVAIACVVALGVGIAVNNYQTKPEQAKPAAEKTEPKPDASKPAQKSPEANKDAKALEVAPNPNYESSVWWKTLAPEVQTDIKELLEAGDAKSYALKFFNEIKLLNINGTVNISEKTKSDLYDQIDKYKGFLNLAYSKSDIVISQCVITVEDATTKEKKDCYVRENVATLANKYRGILGKALGENMYAPFPDEQTLSESYEMMKNKIAAKANEELNKK